ncbi:MAG: hypothetical protein K8H86_05715, partial [Ignavibacteriaceae bacterium]|nr:hypothetical protein [Ignavibacteriaceae bacterium]
YNTLKLKNIKLKILFDDEGFDTMLKLITLANKISHGNAILEISDVNNIIKLLSVAERHGGKAPPGLMEKISSCLYSSIGKGWRDCIKLL